MGAAALTELRGIRQRIAGLQTEDCFLALDEEKLADEVAEEARNIEKAVNGLARDPGTVTLYADQDAFLQNDVHVEQLESGLDLEAKVALGVQLCQHLGADVGGFCEF